jgi:tetratricopeptide (TPR) repeat protein
LRDRFSFVDSEREYRRSLELNPGNSEVHNQYGQLLDAVGRFGDAYEHERTAAALDPLAPNPRYMQGLVLDGVRRHAEAAVAYRETIALAPDFVYAYEKLAVSLSYAGEHAAALTAARAAAEKTGEDAAMFEMLLGAVADPARRHAALAQVANLHRLFYVELGGFARAYWYAWLGAPERALPELEQWAETSPQGQRFNGLRFLWMPGFDPVREDARFKALLQRFGLPDLGVAALRESGASIAASREERSPPP